jgi:ribonuclease P protein component
MPGQYTLGKKERLKRRKIIEQLFSEGRAIHVPPLRAVYKFYTGTLDSPLQTGFTAGSRQFKKSIHRNRIRRLLREAWRLQKNDLKEKLLAEQKQLAVFIVFTGKEMPSFEKIKDQMAVLLNKLTKAVS